MTILNKSLIIAATILIMACGANKSSEDAGISNTMSVNNPVGKAGGDEKNPETDKLADVREDGTKTGEPVAGIEKKLIKNGEVGFQVNDLTATKHKIEIALKTSGGYIAKENSYDYSNNPTDELIVRVPAKDFDRFLAEVLTGVEKIDYKRVDIEDVTEQFVDIEARLRSKRQLETKYAELLTKATNMEDILKIQKEMEIIREEIESAEGRLKYLSNQVGYSTLKITYYEHTSTGFNFGGKMGNALKDGSTGFLWFLIFMVQLWPLWLISGLVWWFIIWLVKRNRRKKLQA
ncbi:MAG TPA: DUF4349 domain-containing protein [Bacteroidia bacterium]|jgi:hypothetical protein|nr:DUF4349 domain-containing protein [Bacteroidia bacterium]